MTQLHGKVALVTGGSRGIGAALVAELLARGAAKVYATARDPRTVRTSGAVALPLELEDPASAAALADLAPDVQILVNNAGIARQTSFLDSSLDDLHTEMNVNFFGTLLATRALVPVIEGNGGGHILTVHSALSWFAAPGTDAYGASKAALWAQTNSLRLALHPRGIGVTGVHVGYVDTDATAGVNALKTSPSTVAEHALDGVEADALEVLVDDTARQLKAALSADPSVLYPQAAEPIARPTPATRSTT